MDVKPIWKINTTLRLLVFRHYRVPNENKCLHWGFGYTVYYLYFQKSTRKRHTIFIKNVVYQYKKIGPFNYSLITERGREGGRWWTGMDPQDGGGSARQSRGACLLDVHLKNVLVSEFLYTNLFFTSRSERLAPFSFRLLLILTYHTRSLFCAFCGGA